MSSIGEMIKRWQIVARTYPDMRYPAYNLHVRCAFDGNVRTNKVTIYLETFVQNEGGTRICLVADEYVDYRQYSPEFLEKALKQFKYKCEITKEKYIFTTRTSVKEPFDFNK